jgi:hypothetical protein
MVALCHPGERMNPAALYELIAATMIATLAVASAADVFILRWVLRGWKAGWPKMAVVHLPNLLILFFLAPVIPRLAPLAGYSALTNFSILIVWAAFLTADIIRIHLKTLPNISRKPWAAFAAVVIVGCLLARVTAQSATGVKGLTDLRDVWWATNAMEKNPIGPEVLPVMRKTFPSDLRRIRWSYASRLGKAGADQPGDKVADFPMPEFIQFMASKRGDFERAPDLQLLEVIRAYKAEDEHLSVNACSEIVSDPNGPASAEDLAVLGNVWVAIIKAERSGIDHPVERTLSPSRPAELFATFARSLPDRLRRASAQPALASALDQCELGRARIHWLSSLPTGDVPYALDLQYPTASGAT